MVITIIIIITIMMITIMNDYHIWKCICKKYSSNTLPHVSRPNWSINVVARHPPCVYAVFWFPKKWLGNSLIFASPTVATKLHPSFSLTPPLAFFPGSFYTALSPLFEHLEQATKPHFVMDLSFSTKKKRV